MQLISTGVLGIGTGLIFTAPTSVVFALSLPGIMGFTRYSYNRNNSEEKIQELYSLEFKQNHPNESSKDSKKVYTKRDKHGN